MKIVFMGTPDFAVPCLERLISDGHEILAVFTQPDKPKGRKQNFTPPPVKVFAESNNIKVFQPKTLKDGEAFKILRNLDLDVIIVVAYGKILPCEIINLPKYGCINVHASLLPRYRGAAPIQWAIINDEGKTGVTTMYMDTGLDTGDMILKSETEIREDETSGELHDRLSKLGADLISETLFKLERGKLDRVKQDDKLSNYAPMLEKSISRINWNKSANEVHNLVRGLNPWPVASTVLNGKVLKIYKSKVCDAKSNIAGEILTIKPFVVGCGDGKSIELLEVQYEGKKRMCAEDFARGFKFSDKFLGKDFL